jgi:putative thioredoxin
MSDSPYIHNVTFEDFQALVIENSFKQPVLVDFWADWCQPCQALMPILSKLADEYNGAFVLAKVNSDEQGELAAQAGVRSLPTVKLFIDGQIVNEFMGALPEGQVRDFLAPYITTQSDVALQEALAAYQQGQPQQALEIMNKALAEDPQNASLKINIAKLVANEGDYESASALMETLSDEQKEQPEARELIAQIKLAGQLKDLGDPAELEQRIEQDANDLEARLEMAQYLAASGQHEAALQLLLEVMQKDASFNDGAARKALLGIFDLLGSDNPLVKTYRRRMMTLLH